MPSMPIPAPLSAAQSGTFTSATGLYNRAAIGKVNTRPSFYLVIGQFRYTNVTTDLLRLENSRESDPPLITNGRITSTSQRKTGHAGRITRKRPWRGVRNWRAKGDSTMCRGLASERMYRDSGDCRTILPRHEPRVAWRRSPVILTGVSPCTSFGRDREHPLRADT